MGGQTVGSGMKFVANLFSDGAIIGVTRGLTFMLVEPRGGRLPSVKCTGLWQSLESLCKVRLLGFCDLCSLQAAGHLATMIFSVAVDTGQVLGAESHLHTLPLGPVHQTTLNTEHVSAFTTRNSSRVEGSSMVSLTWSSWLISKVRPCQKLRIGLCC